MGRFTGKTVIVTGAASGIGRAVVARFAGEGANLVAVDLERAALEAACSGLDATRLLIQPGDTSGRAVAVMSVHAAVERFGGCADQQCRDRDQGRHHADQRGGFQPRDGRQCGWVFPHGEGGDAGTGEAPRLRGDDVLRVRLGGDWEMFAYNTSKGAVSNMVRAMALDAGRHGVRVNAVNPSLTDTGMTKDMQKDGALMAKFRERMPLGPMAQPEDIAAVVAFLASDDARFVTGVNLPVDGGLMASNGQPPQ